MRRVDRGSRSQPDCGMIKRTEILCIGGAVHDRKFMLEGPLLCGTSNPARSTRAFGGVARNVCENLARLGLATALVTRVGEDAAGAAIIRHLAELGVDIALVQSDPERNTAEYLALLAPDGSLQAGVADMAIFDQIELAGIWQADIPGWVFADCNLPGALLAELAITTRQRGARLAVDCVSVAKAMRLPKDLTGIDLLFANQAEADALLQCVMPPLEAAQALLARGASAAIVTLGPGGLMFACAQASGHLPAPACSVVDVTGAGDALVAATLAALACGTDLPAAARRGIEAATVTLNSADSVRADLAQALAARRASQ